jgi:hypothetical protein
MSYTIRTLAAMFNGAASGESVHVIAKYGKGAVRGTLIGYGSKVAVQYVSPQTGVAVLFEDIRPEDVVYVEVVSNG